MEVEITRHESRKNGVVSVGYSVEVSEGEKTLATFPTVFPSERDALQAMMGSISKLYRRFFEDED